MTVSNRPQSPARTTAVARRGLRRARRWGLVLSLALAASSTTAGPVPQARDPGPAPAARAESDEPGVAGRQPAVVPAGSASPERSLDKAPGRFPNGLLGGEAARGSADPDTVIVVDPPWDAAADDPHAQAFQAAAEAALGAHAAREGSQALGQAYMIRPPTWAQRAATVDLGDFPEHEDPSASSEHALQTLQWTLAERERLAAEQGLDNRSPSGSDPDGGRTGRPTAVDPEELGALQLLLPSTWVPLLRDHRDTLLAGAAGLLVSSWIVSWLVARRRTSRSHRSHRSHRGHHRAHGSRRHAGHRDASAAAPAPEASEASTPARSKRRRRRTSDSRSGSGTQPGVALATAHGSRHGGASRRRR